MRRHRDRGSGQYECLTEPGESASGEKITHQKVGVGFHQQSRHFARRGTDRGSHRSDHGDFRLQADHPAAHDELADGVLADDGHPDQPIATEPVGHPKDLPPGASAERRGAVSASGAPA